MLKFPSIDSFRHSVATIKRACDFHRQPLPKLTFEGRVKLHGTNAGIHFNFATEEVTAQSRERPLSVASDNYGFARWVEENKEALLEWAEENLNRVTDNVTVYGEWCGPGIQKTVSLTELSTRQFVIFAIAYDEDVVQNDDGTTDAVYQVLRTHSCNYLTDVPGMYSVVDAPTYLIEIDFSKPDLAVADLERLTTEVENECPYGKMFGISGIGEGLVWVPTIDTMRALDHLIPDNKKHRVWFKTKGEKHGNKGTKNTVKVAVTAEKVEDFNALCDQLLPSWRLQQGWATIAVEGSALPDRGQTGNFIKWICADVYKEELDTVVASEFDWKVVAQELSKRARQWFLEKAC